MEIYNMNSFVLLSSNRAFLWLGAFLLFVEQDIVLFFVSWLPLSLTSYFILPVTVPSFNLWLSTIFKYFQLSSQVQVTLVKNKNSFMFLGLVCIILCIILWLSDILSYRDTTVFLDSNWRTVLWSVSSIVTVTIYILIQTFCGWIYFYFSLLSINKICYV